MEDVNQEAAAPAAAEIKPATPTFVNQKERFRKVPLEWPLEYDGKVYDSVTVRRMSAEDMRTFIAMEDGSTIFPMFDVPNAVIEALDPDDDVRVNEAVQDFLPRALRRAAEPTPPSSATTPQ